MRSTFKEKLRFGAKWLLNFIPSAINKLDFNRQSFIFNERPVEYGFVFNLLARIYPRTILDVGTGTTALPRLMRDCGFHVTAIDNIKDYWVSGMINRHYHVINDDITASRLKRRFDFITCISVLEHIRDSEAAVKEMFRLLKPGGHLALSFPYREDCYIENVYVMPGSSYGRRVPYICQSFSRKQLDQWLRNYGGIIVEQEYWQLWEGDYWTEGQPVVPPCRVLASDKHQLTCLLIQKTYPADPGVNPVNREQGSDKELLPRV